MSLPELIDTIDGLLSSGATISAIRSQLVVLREQAEALEQRLGTLETNSRTAALTKESDRLRILLDEAYQTIERLRYEAAKNKTTRDDRPEVEHRILQFLTQQSKAGEQALSQQLGVTLERIRFHLQEFEKDGLLIGSHFYTGRASEWKLGQEGRRYLNDRNLLN